MRVLGIETATAWGSVAVAGPGGTLAERSAHVPGGHLEWLIPAIDDLLAASHLTRADVEGLAVSIGPGGFTGLRIGVATAAAWAHAMVRPLAGVSTLEAIAAGVEESGLVLATLDARRGEVAAALFTRDDGAAGVERLTDDLLLTPGAIRDHLGRCGRVIIAGDALERHAAVLLGALGPDAVAAPRDWWWPRAAVTGRLGRARLLRGDRDDPIGLVPRYAHRRIAREFAPPRGGGGTPPRGPERESHDVGPVPGDGLR
ncbi:MAG: tRNA (adenosine(37)-N6)-threonylcarbamoyltransferase complex dimerization subunit type 1 TsaB [Armatimonadetes bacterium RBG_16_67_12]|nr:MAG: tRNA (adenosine(37)-N6)-threonylcarbamoyltransferase complex dimerization subunit type 1 TsaB [Armatimonadetes bacterium RBG_16_67_12]